MDDLRMVEPTDELHLKPGETGIRWRSPPIPIAGSFNEIAKAETEDAIFFLSPPLSDKSLKWSALSTQQ